MSPEKVEHLRQYLAGRSEIISGEQLVLRDLRKERDSGNGRCSGYRCC
ncbi:MAG TPA: hypothetical protein VJU53_00150 [Burkholderiaceae bacterium]|nr:hypothetical protein [Burkholderiaceae bacterium]